jgi:hypothetical protein
MNLGILLGSGVENGLVWSAYQHKDEPNFPICPLVYYIESKGINMLVYQLSTSGSSLFQTVINTIFH